LGQEPVGLETQPARKRVPVTDLDEPVSSGPKPKRAAAPRKASPAAAKADDLEAIKKVVDDAASVSGGLWLSYLFVLFYLAIAAGAVTHADLFLENSVKLPFLNIELPLLTFFFLAPILFVIVHAYALVRLVMLTEKAKRYHEALHDPERHISDAMRENLQWQLPSNIFIQFLAGPSDIRRGLFGWSLRAIAWTTLVIAPVLLLLMMQVQFLPFHSLLITWTHRLAMIADLILIRWLWGRMLSGRYLDAHPHFWGSFVENAFAIALSVSVILFATLSATIPGEWQESHFVRLDQLKVPISVHDLVFNSAVSDATGRRALPLSNTIVLADFNIYEELKIDDPDKVKGRDFVFRARGRDLRGAIFNFASLPKVDFEEADLRGAEFTNARLPEASFVYAQLQDAYFGGAQLQQASFENAQLQGAGFFEARLQGASFVSAHLQGASLYSTQLQGASVDRAELQGASLIAAGLQGASLASASLQGASLRGAELQGASLNGAELQAPRSRAPNSRGLF
jgi:uncharacterized protein YjbI with pentapeptide repeats